MQVADTDHIVGPPKKQWLYQANMENILSPSHPRFPYTNPGTIQGFRGKYLVRMIDKQEKDFLAMALLQFQHMIQARLEDIVNDVAFYPKTDRLYNNVTNTRLFIQQHMDYTSIVNAYENEITEAIHQLFLTRFRLVQNDHMSWVEMRTVLSQIHVQIVALLGTLLASSAIDNVLKQWGSFTSNRCGQTGQYRIT